MTQVTRWTAFSPFSVFKLAVLLVSFALFVPFQANATHIVGGEIGYRCLGNDQYEVILSVYRDCINAGPDTEFDDPASVGIFLNSTGALVDTFPMFFMGDDTLREFLLDDCLMVQSPVCVHTTTYRQVITLPFVDGGYELAYQRCCRNETLNNIINPKETGATYTIKLTEAALMNCNASPQFRAWPPIFVCADQFISYDHSASDMDGDSLVYRLCTPNSGATEMFPKPGIPSSPPYDTVVWNAPTYDLENVLGAAGRPLSINPRNGRIIARPGITGQFVVGICVEEYRNGILLSETRRDFQYNVVPCAEIEAVPVIESGDFQCEDLSVVFENGSRDANDFLWTFDLLGDSTLTSTEFSPTFTYPDTGSYRVRLIAEPESTCADTSFINITLVPNSVTAGINIETFDCGDTTVATFLDGSTDSISFINRWEWNVNIADTLYTATEQNPTLFLPRDSSGRAELTVRSNLGCTETVSIDFMTGMSDPTAFLPDTLFICEGDTVSLNPLAPESTFFNYRWRGGVLSPSPNIPNPTANPRNTTTYTARIFPPNSACQVEHDVTVVVTEGPQALAVETIPDCADALTFNFVGIAQGTDLFRWNFGDTTNVGFIEGGSNISYTYPDTGRYEIQFVAVGGTCSDTLTQLIVIDSADSNADVSVSIRDDFIESCDPSVTVTADVTNALTINWLNAQDSVIATTATAELPLVGETTYVVQATSASGCTVVDSIQTRSRAVNVALPSNQDLCLGDTANLTITNLGFDEVNYRWTPDSLIITGADTNSPQVPVGVGERFYEVFMDNAFGCQDSAQIRVTVIDPNLELTFDANVQCDGTSVALVNTTPVEYSRYQWLLGDAGNTEMIGDSVLFNYQVAGDFQVCLTLDYDAACVDTVCQMITTRDGDGAFMPAFNFDIIGCNEDSLTIQFLNESVSSFPDVTYEWTFGDSTVVVDENPILSFTQSQLLPVQLTLRASEDCTASLMQAVPINVLEIALDSITSLCPGSSVVLNPGGNPDLNYQWSPSEGLSDPNAPSPTVSANTTTTYSVVVSNPLNEDCLLTSSTIVDVSGALDTGLPSDLVTCGEELRIGVNPISGVNVTWTGNDGVPIMGDTIIVAADYEGSYIIEAMDTTGMCAGIDTINFLSRGLNIIEPIGDTITTCEGQTVRVGLSNGNPGDTLNVMWSPLDIITRDSNTISPTFFGITDTIMTLYYTAENQFGCMLSDSLAFKVRDFDVRLPEDGFTVCPNAPTELNPDFNPNLEYTWSPAIGLDSTSIGNPMINISDSTAYNVVVTVGQGAGACRDSFLVEVGLRDAAMLMFEEPSLCELEPVTLMVSADREVTYEWSDTPDFDIILGEENTITVMPELGADEFYVRYTDADGGCTSIQTVTVNTFPIDVSLPDVTEVCVGAGTLINVMGDTTEQMLTFDWSPADIVIDGQGTSSPTIETTQIGILSAEVRNQFGCMGTISTELDLIDLSSEDVIINAFPDTIVLGSTSQIQVFINGDFDYRWTPVETLDDPISSMPIASPEQTTVYEVEISQGDCIGTQEVEVVVLTDVCREPYIFIPAAFTPNGDGRNDMLFVRGNPIEEIFFAVYDRWGELVFQTTDKNIGWDGRFNGQELPPDVYGYYLEVTCIDGMEFAKQGNVTILK